MRATHTKSALYKQFTLFYSLYVLTTIKNNKKTWRDKTVWEISSKSVSHVKRKQAEFIMSLFPSPGFVCKCDFGSLVWNMTWPSLVWFCLGLLISASVSFQSGPFWKRDRDRGRIYGGYVWHLFYLLSLFLFPFGRLQKSNWKPQLREARCRIQMGEKGRKKRGQEDMER